MSEVILERFENPDEVRTFEKGKFARASFAIFNKAPHNAEAHAVR